MSTHIGKRNQHIAQLLTDEQTFGTTLLIACVDTWGAECLKWQPHTLRAMLRKEFGVTPDPLNFDKLLAAICILTTDDFYTDVRRFIDLTNALCDGGLSEEFDPADVAECAWAIGEAYLLHPPEDDGDVRLEFSEEIRAYLTHILHDEGFINPPDVLRLALDADRTQQVTEDFHDQPALLEEIKTQQDAKNSELETMLNENLYELVDQLQKLPMLHGSVEDYFDHKVLTAS